MKNRKKNKEEWWIYYRMGHSDYDEDQVVVMPSIGKLLLWMA